MLDILFSPEFFLGYYAGVIMVITIFTILDFLNMRKRNKNA